MKIIIFSGKAENGKTTASTMVKDRLELMGYRVTKLSYGDYVKQTAKQLFGWNGEKDEEGRALLQWWGTDKVRHEKPDFWAETVVRLAGMIKDLYDFAIIDDVRYENEITCWRGYDILTVRVERPGHLNLLTEEQREHISETSLDDFDFDIRLTAESYAELRELVDSRVVEAAIQVDSLIHAHGGHPPITESELECFCTKTACRDCPIGESAGIEQIPCKQYVDLYPEIVAGIIRKGVG